MTPVAGKEEGGGKKKGIRINRSLTIPKSEIRFRFSTSGGPGGQHANKASTRAELTWNVDGSRVLGPRQRERIQRVLRNRIDSNGSLTMTSDRYRSQLRNREEVSQRFAQLVARALRPRVLRVPTAPTEGSKERRLKEKRRRSEIKRTRRVSRRDLESDG